MDGLGQSLAVFGGIVAAIAAMRKAYFWLWPLKICPSYTIVLDGSGPDCLRATVTNRSGATVYLANCIVRGTYSRMYILRRHFAKPWIPPRLYPNVWYSALVYTLTSEPLKLEPAQAVTLIHPIAEHPLNAMYTPKFIVKATLTTGRTVSSTRMDAPAVWRTIGRRGR
jgi:hypothetical protein